MIINMVKISRTIIMPKSRHKSKDMYKRIMHNDYVFLTDIPVDFDQNELDSLIDALEYIIGDDLSNIEIASYYSTVYPGGITTVQFSTEAVLDDVISIELDIT